MLENPRQTRARAYMIWCSTATSSAADGWVVSTRACPESGVQLLGISPEVAQRRFGFLLDAFRYGAPPHGGIAFGQGRSLTTGAEGSETQGPRQPNDGQGLWSAA